MSIFVSLYIWIFGFLYFVFFLLFALICSFLFPVNVYNPWIKAILRFLFTLIGVPVEISGSASIQPGKTYLFMANHQSLFDIPLLGGFIPGSVRGVEAERQHRWPLYGLVMRRIGNISIPRTDILGSISSIRKTVRAVNTGRSMIILPEGHRSIDGTMLPLKKLPFFLAKQIDADLVPIGISGLFQLKAKNSWKITPGPVRISFGAAIPRETVNSLSAVELSAYMREEIQKLIGETMAETAA